MENQTSFVGKVIDSFEFLEKIGSGAFSTVYLVQHAQTKLFCAAKVMDLTEYRDKELQGIYRELTIYSQIDHPYICTLYRTTLIPQQNFLILFIQCAPNGTLLDYVNRCKGLHESEARRLFIQIFSAIRYIHNFFYTAHRDLKLENILLDSAMNVKVTDFGLAGNNYNTKMKTFVGTPGYQAPEIISEGTYTEKCDVWSLGVCLYSMITGFLPFSIQNSSYGKLINEATSFRYPSNFSPHLIDLLTKMWNVNFRERPTLYELQNHPWLIGLTPLPLNVAPQPLSFPKHIKVDDFRELRRKKTRADQSVIEKCRELGFVDMTKLENDLISGEISDETTIYFLEKTPLIKKPTFMKKAQSQIIGEPMFASKANNGSGFDIVGFADNSPIVNKNGQNRNTSRKESPAVTERLPYLDANSPNDNSNISVLNANSNSNMNNNTNNVSTNNSGLISTPGKRRKMLESGSMPQMWTLNAKVPITLSRICGPAPVKKQTRQSANFNETLAATPYRRKRLCQTVLQPSKHFL